MCGVYRAIRAFLENMDLKEKRASEDLDLKYAACISLIYLPKTIYNKYTKNKKNKPVMLIINDRPNLGMKQEITRPIYNKRLDIVLRFS